jgi:methylenetetrahydrofolate--tRNA-(uracil-5-)-methyltransferase
VHGFEENMVFEGCMPVESMARRGHMVLAFGPLKPVGLKDPRTGWEPYAVVQLRQDNREGTLFNLVGFQTRLKFGEQKRVFGMIPGLENAVFARYGVMHRNTFLHSPGLLDESYQVINQPGLYFAGQMTGVEGYVESAASGLVAGVSLACRLKDKEPPAFPRSTALGAMAQYVSTPNRDFQPMNCCFGLIESLPVEPGKKRIRNKVQKYEAIAARSLDIIRDLAAKLRDLDND